MTLGEIKTRCWDRLDESAGSASLRYTSAVLSEYVNDGVIHWACRSGMAYGTETVTQQPYTLMYDLPSTCIQVERVEWVSSGTNYLVLPTTPRVLDAWSNNWRWQRDTATRATHYFIFGLNQIGLYPQIASSTATYTVHYQRDVRRTLGSDSEEPILPLEDHEYLVNYAVGRCLLAEGKAEEGAEEMAAYTEALAAFKQRESGGADRLWAQGASRGWQSREVGYP